MFKIILLTFLVSVVWSTVRATYIISDNNNYGILSNIRFSPYHGPIYQTHLGADFGDDHHGIVIPHISTQEIPYLNSFHKISQSGGFHKHETKQGYHNSFHQNEQSKQTYGTQKFIQQHIEDNDKFKSNHFDNSNQNSGVKKPVQSPKYSTKNQDDVTQQKIENVEFRESPESKSEYKDNKDYDQQKPNQSPEVKHAGHDSNYKFPSYEPQEYPEIYSPLVHGKYIKLHDGNVRGYTEIPSGFGTAGPVYKVLSIPASINYHPALNSHGALHSNPILYSGNFHESLDLGDIVHSDLGAYSFLGTNGSHPGVDNYPKYPEQKKDDSEDNYEYKDIGNSDAPKYSDSGKKDTSYNVEQKSLDVGVKEKSGQESFYSSDDQQYKVENDPPKYSETKIKQSVYNLEQKSVDVGITGSKDKNEFDGIGSSSDYPTSKDSVTDTQQKAVDVDFKSSGGASDYKPEVGYASAYPGIGNIGAPKYPASKLEQKTVGTETYREIKSSFKSTKNIPGPFGSGINNYKKDTGSKFEGYQTPLYVNQEKLGNTRNQGYPSGLPSTSYFNTGRPSSGSNNFNNRRDSPFSNSNYGNNYGNSGLSRTNDYFGRRNPNPYGSTVNYHRPVSGINNQFRGNSFGGNYQRPISSSSPFNNRYSNQQSEYSGIGGLPPFPGPRSFSSGSSFPKYQDNSSSRRARPTYFDSPDTYNNEKKPKINYEYPNQSSKKDEPIYASSLKPTSSGYPVSSSGSRLDHYKPLTSVSYLKNDKSEPSSYPANGDKDSSPFSGTDYSSGIGGVEDKSSTYDDKSPEYTPPQSSKLPKTEQKLYDNEEPTYSDAKSDTYKPPEDDYKGIGEVGSIPSTKTEIVGGRHPVKRPSKVYAPNTKSSPKGKGQVKAEQKYLPITAVLSDAKSDYPESKPSASKKYDDAPKPKSSVKTKAPEKIEQQEEIEQKEDGYEALLAGAAPQTDAQGSSGYGFDKLPASNSGSPTYGSGNADEHLPPMPYEFGYEIKDDEHDSEQYRREKMDDSGYLTGSYGFRDAEGIYRQVEYEASKDGFKVNKIKTNEPGTDNEDPADVHFEVDSQR